MRWPLPMVEEEVRGKRVFNNPAGHLEPGESFIDAVRRETLEEPAGSSNRTQSPESICGRTRRWTPLPACGLPRRCLRHHPDRKLDQGIVAPHWLTRAELAGDKYQRAHHWCCAASMTYLRDGAIRWTSSVTSRTRDRLTPATSPPGKMAAWPPPLHPCDRRPLRRRRLCRGSPVAEATRPCGGGAVHG